MKFISNIGDTYKHANTENKQRLLRMVCEMVTYDNETEELKIKLKPIFQALRIIKNNQKICSNKVTTLESLAITQKEPLNEVQSLNGAPNGLEVDPVILNFSKIVTTTECEYCLYKLSKLVA